MATKKPTATTLAKPKPGGQYKQATVYSCCARYYAKMPGVTKTCTCDICGAVLNAPISLPRIFVID